MGNAPPTRRNIRMSEQSELVLALVSLRSLFNVGSIFRTADAIGASKIYLTGYTGTPEQSKVAKTALGAEQRVAWEKVASVSTLIGRLKQDGFTVVAVERTDSSIDYRSWTPAAKTALFFGNEVTGLSERVLKHCDLVVHLPMAGIKESLNVGVTAGALGYQWLARRQPLA